MICATERKRYIQVTYLVKSRAAGIWSVVTNSWWLPPMQKFISKIQSVRNVGVRLCVFLAASVHSAVWDATTTPAQESPMSNRALCLASVLTNQNSSSFQMFHSPSQQIKISQIFGEVSLCRVSQTALNFLKVYTEVGPFNSLFLSVQISFLLLTIKFTKKSVPFIEWAQYILVLLSFGRISVLFWKSPNEKPREIVQAFAKWSGKALKPEAPSKVWGEREKANSFCGWLSQGSCVYCQQLHLSPIFTARPN